MAMPRLDGSIVGHALPADLKVARGDRLEPGDHPQECRFSAAGGPDEDDKLLASYVEIDTLDDLDGPK